MLNNIGKTVAIIERNTIYENALSVDMKIAEDAYARGRESGIGLGRNICELALQTGQSFDEICDEFEIPRLCNRCGSIVRKLTVCVICDEVQR